MTRRGRYETHENAQPNTERSQFAAELHASALDPSKGVGVVERLGPINGVRPRRVYFTDPSRVRWRVKDASFGPPHGQPYEERHFSPPYAPAKGRVFIAANGDRRMFNFRDRHAPEEIKRPLITAQILSAQFRFAGPPQSTLEEENAPRRDLAVLPPSK